MKSRIKYIDIAKAIGIYLLIVEHMGFKYGDYYLKIVITSFHMPLFFILSGMVLNTSKTFKEHIISRAKSILIPYVIWALISCRFSWKNLLYIFYASNKSLSCVGDFSVLWFLPCLFLADIFTYAIVKFKNQLFFILFSIAGCGAVSLCLKYIVKILKYDFPWSFDVALTATCFILFGYIISENKLIDKIKNMTKLSIVSVVCLLLIITAVSSIFNYGARNNVFGCVVMAWGLYGNYFLFCISSFFGSVLIILLSSLLESIRGLSQILQKIGQVTLLIMVIHQQIIILLEKIAIKFYLGANFPLLIVFSLITLFVSYFLAEVIMYLIPNLAGKNMNK